MTYLFVILMPFGYIDVGEDDETMNPPFVVQFQLHLSRFGSTAPISVNEQLHNFKYSTADFKAAEMKQFFYMKNTSYNIVLFEEILKKSKTTAPDIGPMDMILVFITVITLGAMLASKMLACNQREIVSIYFQNKFF